LRLVRPGGVIIADNVLWSGRVADPKVTDPDTEGLRAYARRIAGDDRLESVILTVGDGLAVSRMRRHEELEA
jgi:caffeoyl-CoA O-methyltransferase